MTQLPILPDFDSHLSEWDDKIDRLKQLVHSPTDSIDIDKTFLDDSARIDQLVAQIDQLLNDQLPTPFESHEQEIKRRMGQ